MPHKKDHAQTSNLRHVHQRIAHDSAYKHVSGKAQYIDDIAEPQGTLHTYIGMSRKAHALIKKIDLSAVEQMPGVRLVLSAKDVPGKNDIGEMFPGDPIFAEENVEYVGQSLFAVIADTRELAYEAAQKANIVYEELDPILTIDDALEKKSYVLKPRFIERGNPEQAISKSSQSLKNTLYIGGQDHFYLEGQISMAVPKEDDDILVYCSAQHPCSTQHHIANVLNCPQHSITVETRRMGGAFGGKESQCSLFACIAALGAYYLKKPVKVRLDRDDDMVMTGKRHDFKIEYNVGFNDQGVIQGLDLMLASNCGMSPELSAAVNDRAVFHTDNCYYLENVKISSYRCKTHTVSNTAFRGFGGPQGMMAIEHILDDIAYHLKNDAVDIRKRNFYQQKTRNKTPYGMTVEDNIIDDIVDKLRLDSKYDKRQKEIQAFNKKSPYIKKGISLMPIKFGISFTATHLNQAGALVNIYNDGSIHLNHGGTEMGQGLFIKVAQIVADEFGIDLNRVKISASHTEKVPNASSTAASTGSDLNGKAAQIAAQKIKKHLIDFAMKEFDTSEENIEFRENHVFLGNKRIPFPEFIYKAYMARTCLSSTGFYKTPDIHFDFEKWDGRPFYYFAYGAAVSEVMVDTLTGENKVTQIDILHDCGKSLNPAIDLGQIEGGFIQGMGWLTTEELWWNENGELKTHAPSTYKIPVASDVPEKFNVSFWKQDNQQNTIHKSKAVGEPPLMLAISVYRALRQAVWFANGCDKSPQLNAPATPERILFAIDDKGFNQ